MPLLHILILAIVQGLSELLPVSSSAHVVVIEKLLGLDPSSPPMTLLLVMLHTGTMFAVIVSFWRQWRDTYFQSIVSFKSGHTNGTAAIAAAVFPSLLGAVFAFLAGLIALKWLSGWLEGGRWYLFGIYCLMQQWAWVICTTLATDLSNARSLALAARLCNVSASGRPEIPWQGRRRRVGHQFRGPYRCWGDSGRRLP